MLLQLEVKCRCCGSVHIVNVPSVPYRLWASGQARIQDALPMLSADERELLMSGLCTFCFDKFVN